MDGVTLQALVAKGYGKAASRIGTPHSWYRGGAITPIQPANLLGNRLELGIRRKLGRQRAEQVGRLNRRNSAATVPAVRRTNA